MPDAVPDAAPDPVPEVVVVGEAPDPLADGGAQVTDLDPRDLPAGAELPDALVRVPGAVVTRLGGPGDYAQVSLRGAGARHTEVFLDGIPLNPEGGAAVDLSELPVSAFERIRVVRGPPPAHLGSTALGGAVLLIPGAGDRAVRALTLSAGTGPTARGAAVLAGPVGPAHVWTAVDGLGTTGAFRTFDDGGTRYDASDDRIRRRENNDTERLSTLARVAGGGLTVLHSGLWRRDGVPGFTFAPSPTVRYGLTRHVGAVRLERPVGAALVTARATAVARDEHLADPNDEIGIGGGTRRDRTRSAGGDLGLRAPVTRTVGIDLLAGARADRYTGPDLVASRVVARAAAGAPIAVGAADVSPGAVVLAVVDGGDPAWFGAPRVGARLDRDRWAFRAHAGGAVRPPDLTELYGDRGALVGNPDLRPERGLQVDLGTSWSGPGARIELAAFFARYRDLVAWVTGPTGVSRPENVGRADVGGLEGAVTVRRGIGSLTAAGTLTRAANRSDDPAYRGNQLPRVPWAHATVATAIAPGRWRFGADGTLASATWADTANFTRWPPRALLGATAAVHLPHGEDRGDRVAVELDVRNVLDQVARRVPRDRLAGDDTLVREPLVDFVGFPLPGRTVTLSVRVR